MIFRPKRNWLIVPIETKAREFHAKLLLSCVAAEKGFSVVLGGQCSIENRLTRLPKGIFFDKSIVPLREMLFRQYRSVGLRVATLCEEGLTIIDPAAYLQSRVNCQALRQARIFFAWGDYQAELIRGKCPDCSGKVVAAGNSRIDLLRPELRSIFDSESGELKSRHGKYILINTNFSFCNHKLGAKGAIARLRDEGKVTTREEEELLSARIAHKQSVFDKFGEMIPEIRKNFPDQKIIIRPHPSENHAVWVKIAGSVQGVEVIYEGGVVPWIMAADAVIHNGCTTGIEAFLLGRTAIAYQPVISEEHDAHLPNILSLRAFDLPGLVGLIRSRVCGELLKDSSMEEKRKIAGRYLSNLEGSLATDVIVDHLKSPDLLSGRQHGEPSHARVAALRMYVNIRDLLRKAIGRYAGSSEYSLQKFPGLKIEEVLEWLEKFRRVTGRFSNVGVKRIHKNIFVLERKQTGC